MRSQKILAVLAITASILAGTISEVSARSYRTSASDVRVNGYYRSNGTYVQPYYRTRSDSYKGNNYSCYDYGRCR